MFEKEIVIDYDLDFSKDENSIVKFFSNNFFKTFDDSFAKKFNQMFIDFHRQEICINHEPVKNFYDLLEYIGKKSLFKNNQEKVFVSLSQTILSVPVDIIQKSILGYEGSFQFEVMAAKLLQSHHACS